MAVAFVAEAHSSSEENTSSITVTKPAGVIDGHLILVFLSNFAHKSQSAPDESWTKYSYTQEGSDIFQTVFAKIASSEGASWTFTQAEVSWNSWFALAYSGVDAASPINVFYNGNSYVTSDTTVRASTITTTEANTLVVWMGSWIEDVGGAATVLPSSFTERINYSATVHAAWVGDKVFSSAGATGNVDLTVTSATTYKDACMVALKPAADAPEAPTINAYQSGSNIIVAWS